MSTPNNAAGGSQNPVGNENYSDEVQVPVTPQSEEQINGENTNPQGQEGASETPNDAQSQVDENAGGTEQSQTTEQNQSKKPKSDAQKRIDTLTRRRYQLEAENDRLRQELESRNRGANQSNQSNQPDQGQAQLKPAIDPAKPRRDDYATYDEWMESLSVYNTRQELANRDRAISQRTAAEQQARVSADWSAKLGAAREKYEDFDDIVGDPTFQIPIPALGAVMDSEIGADISYYLAEHRDEAKALFNMTPAGAVRAIGKLEAKLEAAKPAGASSTNPVTTTTTQNRGTQTTPRTLAGKPPNTASGGRSIPAQDPEKMNYQEYKAYREGQLRARRGK